MGQPSLVMFGRKIAKNRSWRIKDNSSHKGMAVQCLTGGKDQMACIRHGENDLQFLSI